MKETINLLKESPLFNLSLSSKELFHSNFIAWLISEYPNEMWRIFSKYTSLETSKYKIKKDSVDREQKHIDIMFDVVEIGGDETKATKIIIENKVKSLPYKEQLEKYATKFPDASCILLTLSKPEHLTTDSKVIKTKHQEWHILTYSLFVNELSSIDFNYQLSNNVDDQNPVYHKKIKKDYINFVNLLVDINEKTKINNLNEQFDWYGSTFNALDKIRLADFYIKKKCENMALLIQNEIKKLGVGDEKSISVSSSIVRSTNGEFRLYYKFNDRAFVSMEVSRMYYRKLVYVSNKYEKNKKTLKYKAQFNANDEVFPFYNNLNWYSFENIPDNKKDLSYKSRGEFNSFGDAKYAQCKLNDSNTIADIINYFKKDFQYIVSKSNIINSKFTL
ncbi:MAG: PD-(D/E)XK nuclease family protein [Bacteroidales bacterium]|jgi:hypothetical protein